MRWRPFLGGFALGAVLVGGSITYLAVQEENKPVLMPRYHFFDSAKHGSGDGYIMVEGSVAGEEVDKRANHFDMSCQKERGTCEVITIDGVGHNHIGGPEAWTWRIVSWEPDLVVVDSNPPREACTRVQLNILRREETVQYVRLPVNENAASPNCEWAEMRVFRWRIDDPLYWRRAEGRE